MSFHEQQTPDTAAATAVYAYVREQALSELGTILDDQGISRETANLEDHLFLVMHVIGRLQADLSDPKDTELLVALHDHVQGIVSFHMHMQASALPEDYDLYDTIFAVLTDCTMPHLQDALMTGFENGLTFNEYKAAPWSYPSPVS